MDGKNQLLLIPQKKKCPPSSACCNPDPAGHTRLFFKKKIGSERKEKIYDSLPQHAVRAVPRPFRPGVRSVPDGAPE